MKTKEQLLNNIIGQLNGVGRMMNDEKDCFQVLTQMKAVKSAFSNLMYKYVEENAISCVKTCNKKSSEENLKKLILELIKSK